LKAMETAPMIYSFHKIESNDFIKRFTDEHGFKSKLIKDYNFPLKRAFFFHTKMVHHVRVGLWKIQKRKV